jgi:hypothetical protein
MDRMQAPPRNAFFGLLSDLASGTVGYMQDPRRTQQMQLYGQLLEGTRIPSLLEGLSYGDSMFEGSGVGTLRPNEDFRGLIELATTFAPAGKPAAAAAKAGTMALGRAGERMAERVVPQVMERGGLPAEMLGAMAQGTQSRAYLPNTPLKPNPVVGTRFEREFQGGLADKTPVDAESLLGSSLLVLPWDSTNRNMLVKSISDVELPSPVLTTGGQDFARSIENMRRGIAGASNSEIADRILGRVDKAREENLRQGGSGIIHLLPSTMGEYGENFSTQPADILLGLADMGKLTKSEIKMIDDSIRAKTIPKTIKVDGKKQRIVTSPFTKFKGIMTEAGRDQLRTGAGLDTTPGELRKALTNRMYLQNVEKRLGFNQEDLIAAITDPALVGVPKGYVGNTIIRASDEGFTLPSSHPAYDTDFSGQYLGSLMQNIPIEVALPKAFAAKAARHVGKKSDLRTMTIGDLEKSKEGVSEFVDDQTINSLMEYMLRNQPR